MRTVMIRPLPLPIAALMTLSVSLSVSETARAQAPAPSGSQQASPQDRADALFLQGKAAAQAKNWDEAHKLLAQAWELKQSYDIASNLGQVAYLLGKHAEAAQHVAFALRHYPATGDAEQKQKAQDLLDLVRQKVSSLSFRVSPREAEVLVDGASVGSASALPPELFVDPGERTVTARHEGETVERHVSAKAGGHYNLELTLTDNPAAAVAAPVPPHADDPPAQPEDVPPPSDSAIPTKYIVVGVGAALTIGSGIALGIFASKYSKAESDIETYTARVKEESDDPKACAHSQSESCENLAQAYDDRETSGRARNIFLGTTLALGAATIATLFWPSDSDEASSTALTPILTPEHQGLLFSGSF